MWKSPACLSANDSVRLTEIRDCDCAETIPLGALSREWSPFKGKRCGTCIWHNYEGTPITSTSKRSKDPASLSNCERRRDPLDKWSPSSPLPSIWETTFHELVSHFLKTLFLHHPLSMYAAPPSVFALENNSLSFNGVVPHLFADS